MYSPETDDAWRSLLARASREDHELLLVCLADGGAIAGSFELSQIFRGGFQNAYLAFRVGAAYVGQGLMSEGLQLTLSHAFTELGLHRVEANVQPGNARSRALVERGGFRLEGFSPRYLRIGGEWRDHERWAITVEDWEERPPRAERR
jgi:[ribosomal protein S5]-alanine N-acetyltransferase